MLIPPTIQMVNTQNIYIGNFTTAEERVDLIRKATREGVKESVRIFLASKIDQYVVNEKIDGVINDFGAGVPTRFTPITPTRRAGHLPTRATPASRRTRRADDGG